MKKLLGIIIVITLTFSCKNKENKKTETTVKTEFQEVTTTDYVLNKPTKNIKAVLILFGGYPENANDIKREFKILENAQENNVAVLYMNYNRKLWLEQHELLQLSEQLTNIVKEHELPTDNVYIGGFSSGGNIALLISNFITKQNSDIIPKGVFIGDSPIDLASLYNTVEKNVKRDFSGPVMEESIWLLETLGKQFGNPNSNISKYEAYSIFTSETNNIDNLKYLKNTKIRLYTEPDSLWWKKRARVKYEEMNAYRIKGLSESLNTLQFKDVEYIPTVDKGYRSNGERDPHSWSIIDTQNLIAWMLKK
ncbi:hypothetical protein ACFFVB_10945 [Formosa undariae]|uniref:Alpha/beta hydrolase n=1 Tax=Formosa undariae TaxID=1325436 RepID=A0ABV5F2D1_9FLAO